MTTINEARDAAYKRVIAEWISGEDPLTPYCFDNETFTPPEGEDGRVAPWARFSVRHISGGFSTLGSVGNRKVTRKALVRCELYSVPGSGLKAADALTKAAVDMFEGRYLAGALTYDAQPAEVGLVDDGRWFLSTVQAYFDYEAIK
jgi:hypothetical protein